MTPTLLPHFVRSGSIKNTFVYKMDLKVHKTKT